MRGRLYPQPRQRYERFRLNPYSPLYQGLAFFACAPPVAGTRPELHGPYAPPGVVYSLMHVSHRFFPEIGRAAIAYYYAEGLNRGPLWRIALPPQEIITLTIIIMVPVVANWDSYFGLVDEAQHICVGIGEWSNHCEPTYYWRNVDDTVGQGRSNFSWPLNTWFTYSATFRNGSVSGYLSKSGIIPVTLTSGVWPNTIKAARYLAFGVSRSGAPTADGFVHLRELSLTELHAISDLGNVDYRMPGEAPLILPVRTYWPSVLPVAPSYLKRRSLGIRVGTREAAL
jgi:hypothetical protein